MRFESHPFKKLFNTTQRVALLKRTNDQLCEIASNDILVISARLSKSMWSLARKEHGKIVGTLLALSCLRAANVRTQPIDVSMPASQTVRKQEGQ